MSWKSANYRIPTKEGFIVKTERRKSDGQCLVIVEHEEAMIKLQPVDTEEEMKQWFWKFVEDFGGEE